MQEETLERVVVDIGDIMTSEQRLFCSGECFQAGFYILYPDRFSEEEDGQQRNAQTVQGCINKGFVFFKNKKNKKKKDRIDFDENRQAEKKGREVNSVFLQKNQGKHDEIQDKDVDLTEIDRCPQGNVAQEQEEEKHNQEIRFGLLETQKIIDQNETEEDEQGIEDLEDDKKARNRKKGQRRKKLGQEWPVNVGQYDTGLAKDILGQLLELLIVVDIDMLQDASSGYIVGRRINIPGSVGGNGRNEKS